MKSFACRSGRLGIWPDPTSSSGRFIPWAGEGESEAGEAAGEDATVGGREGGHIECSVGAMALGERERQPGRRTNPASRARCPVGLGSRRSRASRPPVSGPTELQQPLQPLELELAANRPDHFRVILALRKPTGYLANPCLYHIESGNRIDHQFRGRAGIPVATGGVAAARTIRAPRGPGGSRTARLGGGTGLVYFVILNEVHAFFPHVGE